MGGYTCDRNWTTLLPQTESLSMPSPPASVAEEPPMYCIRSYSEPSLHSAV